MAVHLAKAGRDKKRNVIEERKEAILLLFACCRLFLVSSSWRHVTRVLADFSIFLVKLEK